MYNFFLTLSYRFLVWGIITSIGAVATIKAQETSDTQSFSYTTSQVSTLTKILPKIQQLMEDGLSASEICVVLDVHGTLTRDSGPVSLTTMRQGTEETLNTLKALSVPIIYSSAWASNFRYTQSTQLENFDTILNDVAEADAEIKDFNLSDIHYSSIVLEDQEFDYAKYKNVISVRLRAGEDPYSRYKAYAPFIYCKSLSLKLKTVLFVDDSTGNHRIFLQSLRDYNPYPALQNVQLVLIHPESQEVQDIPQTLPKASPQDELLGSSDLLS